MCTKKTYFYQTALFQYLQPLAFYLKQTAWRLFKFHSSACSFVLSTSHFCVHSPIFLYLLEYTTTTFFFLDCQTVICIILQKLFQFIFLAIFSLLEKKQIVSLFLFGSIYLQHSDTVSHSCLTEFLASLGSCSYQNIHSFFVDLFTERHSPFFPLQWKMCDSQPYYFHLYFPFVLLLNPLVSSAIFMLTISHYILLPAIAASI